MKARNLGYFGIILTIISAIFYITYPLDPLDGNFSLYLYLSIIWISALFSGVIVGMSVERQKEEKKKLIERGKEWD